MSETAKPARKGAPPGNQYAAGHGRPTKYEANMPERAFRLGLLGLTDAEIAHAFGISETTINAWKHEHPEFSEALTRAKAEADAEVAHGLYQRATGFTHREKRRAVAGKPEAEAKEVEVATYYPPEPQAARYWLNNRQRGLWRERIEHGGDADAPLQLEVMQRRVVDPRLLDPEQRELLRQVLASAMAALPGPDVIEGECEEVPS